MHARTHTYTHTDDTISVKDQNYRRNYLIYHTEVENAMIFFAQGVSRVLSIIPVSSVYRLPVEVLRDNSALFSIFLIVKK